MSRFLLVAVQLGLVLLAVRLYHIEELTGFVEIAPLIFAGFLIHAWLPRRLRLPFFLLLSVLSIGWVLGVVQGAVLLALGLGLFGLCHLPLPFAARALLLALAGGALAAVRSGWLPVPWEDLPTVILPALAAMFMFRVAIYLYDLAHERRQASIWGRLAYFFMLPNACFPLYPIVDYRTFHRSYYAGDPWRIYQKGLSWMLRGILHLLLYRVVYYYWVPAPAEVSDLGGVIVFMISTYMLYLRISGQFHLIVGVLCLFGFNLPETHRLYFLASSFTDYWRRINIYWKDFMQKMVFLPVYAGLRGMSLAGRMVGATVAVFFCTWLLHSYQWFWLRGSFPLRAVDAVFWGVLGLFVLINGLLEIRRPRQASPRESVRSLGSCLRRSAKTVGMFAFISVIWSLWSSESVAEWVAVVRRAAASPPADFARLLLVLAGLIAAGALVQYLPQRLPRLREAHRPFQGAAGTLAAAGLLVAVGLPAVQARLAGGATQLVASLQAERLSRHDETLLQRGYYEQLLGQERFTSGLWRLEARRPADWVATYDSPAVRRVPGLLQYELISSAETTVKGVTFTTNRWGMRDRDYPLDKPAGAYRIALMGSSQLMGGGVEDHEVVDAVLEDRLNRELAGGGAARFEVLNFAVGGYSVLQNRVVAERKVPPFRPDAVVYVVHTTEKKRLLTILHRAIDEPGRDHEYPFVRRVLERSGVASGMVRADKQKLLVPHFDEIIAWAFEGIAEACRAHGAIPVMVFAPTPQDERSVRRFADEILAMGREAGFLTLDLTSTFRGGPDMETLRLAPWDRHPNAQGHALLADGLFGELRRHAAALGLDDLGSTIRRRNRGFAPTDERKQPWDFSRHSTGS